MTPFFSDDWLTVFGGDCREVLPTLAADTVDCIVTSPPYWGLRDYGTEGQLGLERTPEEYIANLVGVFRELRRILKPAGTCWLNLGDSYATGAGSYRNPGSDVRPIDHGGKQGYTRDYARAQPNPMPIAGLKPKDLVGIPWRVAFALQADGWYLRSDIVWSKPNPMPESVTDRPTKSHEYLFLLTKSARYYFDADAVREPGSTTRAELLAFGDERPDVGYPGHSNGRRRYRGPNGAVRSPHGQGFTRRSDKQTEAAAAAGGATERRMSGFNDRWDAAEDAGTAPLTRNIRTVWTIPTRPYPGAHFAVFPPEIPERCIKAGSRENGVVLDPFGGSGTVGVVANRLSRRAILIDLNPAYLEQQMKRNAQTPLGLAEVPA